MIRSRFAGFRVSNAPVIQLLGQQQRTAVSIVVQVFQQFLLIGPFDEVVNGVLRQLEQGVVHVGEPGGIVLHQEKVCKYKRLQTTDRKSI